MIPIINHTSEIIRVKRPTLLLRKRNSNSGVDRKEKLLEGEVAPATGKLLT